MFVLLVLSVMIIAGTVLITQVGEFYSQRFSDNMTRAFDEEVTSKLFTPVQAELRWVKTGCIIFWTEKRRSISTEQGL